MDQITSNISRGRYIHAPFKLQWRLRPVKKQWGSRRRGSVGTIIYKKTEENHTHHLDSGCRYTYLTYVKYRVEWWHWDPTKTNSRRRGDGQRGIIKVEERRIIWSPPPRDDWTVPEEEWCVSFQWMDNLKRLYVAYGGRPETGGGGVQCTDM